AIDRTGLILGDAADGFFLYEPALQRVNRCQAVVLGLERAQRAGDSEQLADKILDMGREFNDQIRLLFAIQRTQVFACGNKPLQEGCVYHLKMLAESGVQTHQSFAPVEVLKRESKLKIELSRTGMHQIGLARKSRPSLTSRKGS